MGKNKEDERMRAALLRLLTPVMGEEEESRPAWVQLAPKCSGVESWYDAVGAITKDADRQRWGELGCMDGRERHSHRAGI